MVRLAAAAAGFAALWMVLRPRFDLPALLTAAAALAVLLLILQRLRLLQRGDGPSAMSRAGLWASGLGARTANALGVIAAAFSARDAISPALVRVRTRTISPAARAAFAHAASAAPGLVAVDVGEEALLLHALREDRVDVTALAQLEARVEAASGAAQ